MLAKSKLSSLETLISRALIDMDVSHEKCYNFTICYNLRSENEEYKMRLSSVKSKI